MFWSKAFIFTLKETPQEAETASHKLMLRAGLIRMLMAGVYSYLPLGLKVLNNIQKIVREEIDALGASEVLLPTLQPQELWQRSGRDKDMGEVMIKFVDRKGRHVCLGPTHEEVITDLVRNHISSYKQLPLILYQIQTKFRDEIRPRFGLIRACEFIMKDAYSFDSDQAGLDKNYKLMYRAYEKIFKRCGLNFLVVEADPGVMGGSLSHEFMVPAQDGEDLILFCPKCKLVQTFKEETALVCPKCGQKLEKINCIEVGHIFQLGTKYSSMLGANFLDAKGIRKPIIMGCYGIGVSRLISAIIAQNHDSEGIIWPKEISPYKVIILPLDVTNRKIMKIAQDIYKELERSSIDILLDDRDERAGVKFKDADLIGIPISITIGQKMQNQNKFEIKIRKSKKVFLINRRSILKKIKDLLKT
jgi:prolyl-tRNA synthetase